MKFTDSYIRNLKPADKKYYKREDDGFTVRVLPSGVKTFLFIYTYDGRRREMNLGSYPDKSLATAKRDYAAAYAMLHDKQNPRDPQAERDQQHDTERLKRKEYRDAPTVSKLCEEYITRHAKRFKRSWKKDERILDYDVVPAWGNDKAANINKRDVVLLLEKIVERGSPAMANNTFQVIRKMFNWAVEQDILRSSPCAGVKLPAPKVERSRTLTEAEIKTLWANLEFCAMSLEVRRALRLILLTAQRPGEVIGMHTSEIDGSWWTIPAERSKNGKANRIFLTTLAQQLIADEILDIKRIREIPADVDYEGYIFPTPSQKKQQAIDGQALVVAVARNLAFPLTDNNGDPLYLKDGTPATENKLGIDKFTPHDLRRTAATFMAELGEMDEVIDAILNHAKKGVIKVYNQYRYDKEKQMALESWERKLNSIITGTANKVIPIRRKSA
jgi:integrase